MKKIIIGTVLVILVFTGAYISMKKNGVEQKYTTQKVSRGDIRATVVATGTVTPVTTVLVGTQVSGTIKNLYVDFNSSVKQGQLLAQIDPATFEGQVEQARANRRAAEANVKRAEAALMEARRQLERNKTLFSRNLIAKSELDAAETNEMSAAAQLEAARAQVEQAKAALTVAEINLQYTSIVSPVDGMVISRNVDVGQTVAASFQTPTLFNIARDLSKMQISASVDEADIGRLQEGQAVEFTVDAYPERIFKGKVAVIRNAPITVQNVVTYEVIVLVSNPDMILKPGMTANVAIIIAERHNVLRAPNAALRFRPADKDLMTKLKASERKGPVVWLLDNRQPKMLNIVTGISDGQNTEVVSGALKNGDNVITAGDEAANRRSSFGRRGFF